MLSFDEAVERIRELSAQEGMTAFEMGDVVLAVCPPGTDHARNDRGVLLAQLAEATGVAAETLRARAFVSQRIPDGKRLPSVSWSAYLLVAHRDDAERERLLTAITHEPPPSPYKLWSVNAVRQMLGKAPTWAADAIVAVESASPETKAEVFQTLAADDHIVNEASDYTTPTAQALGQLEVASSHRAAQRTADHYADDPVIRALDEQRALLDLATTLRTFAEQIEALRPRCPEIPHGAEDRRGHDLFLTAALERALDAMRWAAEFITTGRTDLDTFLGEVLHGERRG